MAGEIPKTMQALVLGAYGPPPFPLRVETKPVPVPGRGEVLIRMAASPVNPSDIHFLEGQYAFHKKLPAVPGLEGCGRVVAVGPGLLARRLAGKRVACSPGSHASGAWAQFAVARATSCFRLPDRIDDDHGAMALVNPLAAIGLMERVKALRAKAFVSTAAASALGQMLLRVAASRGTQVINVVRRPDQVALLKQRGAAHVLNSESSNFAEQLRELCRQLDARVALDAIGGEMTTQLLSSLPSRSHVIVYGGLARRPSLFTALEIVFQGKSVEGFYVPAWLAAKSLPRQLLLERRVPRLLDGTLRTEVRAHTTLADAPRAIDEYKQATTGGKLLIVPN